jgi:hypothetical protein
VEISQRILRHAPFLGPAPINNYWSLLALKDDDGEIAGEEIELAVRRGLLWAERITSAPPEIKGGDAGPYGEVPTIELTHRYLANDS